MAWSEERQASALASQLPPRLVQFWKLLPAEKVARSWIVSTGREYFKVARTKLVSGAFGMPGKQVSVINEDSSKTRYWFVEANLWARDCKPPRMIDESERFVKEGVWRHDSPDNTAITEKVKLMKPGERIAIKDFHVRNSGLPFHTYGGNPVCLMNIKAVGAITAVDLNGESVDVEWRLPARPRKWYFHAQRYCVWGLKKGNWRDNALIDFAFNGGQQDLRRFHADYPWLPIDRKKREAEEEKKVQGYIAFLSSLDPQYFSRDRLCLLDRADVEAIHSLVANFLEAWPSLLQQANPLCRINFKKFKWSNWSNLANIDFVSHDSLRVFLGSLGDLVESLIRVKEHAKELNLSVPQKAQDLYDKLSNTDKDILFLICQGWKDKDIASELHMSLSNVKKRASQFIYQVLEVKNRTGAAAFIAQHRPLGSQNRRRK